MMLEHGYQLIYVLGLGCPRGADADAGVLVIDLLPYREQEVFREFVNQFVR